MKEKLIFVHNTKAQWISNDIDILKQQYDVFPVYINSLYVPWFRHLLTLRKCKIVYFWFGSLSFFPLAIFSYILRKKLVIVAGGFDVASFSQEGYGAFTFGKVSVFLRTLQFKLADRILPVSNFTAKEAIKNAKVSSNKITVIPNCVTGDVLCGMKKKPEVLMVSNIDAHRYRIKGFDRFLEVVELAQDINFTHVGDFPQNLKETISIPKNLNLCGKVEGEDLKKIYASHKVLVQLSRYESFCMSVVEAALHGCFPLVSSGGALPEVVEPIGEVLLDDSPKFVADRLRVLLWDTIDSDAVSRAAQSSYGFERRKEMLLRVLSQHFS